MAQHEKFNPANQQASRVTEENRIPMGLPETTLGIPEIEGYVLYWYLDSPGRIPRALRAGWEFVTPDEVQLNNHGFASDPASDGNSSLGNRVSVFGATEEHGKTQDLYLMKIKKEWHDNDEQNKIAQLEKVVGAIQGNRIGVANEVREDGTRYRYGNLSGNPFPGRR